MICFQIECACKVNWNNEKLNFSTFLEILGFSAVSFMASRIRKKEITMEKLLQELLRWIEEADKPIILGVSGHGAAGKTTFTDRLNDMLGRKEINYLNTDPYIVSSTLRKHTLIDYTYQNENHRFKMTACHPAAHHLPSLERDIRMLKKGLDLYTIDTHWMKSELLASGKGITIVEGMSVAFIDPTLFDLKIYFYTDEETELARRSERDVSERGTDLNYLKQSHKERRIQYELFMHPYSKHFDIIIKATGKRVYVEKSELKFKC